MADIVLKVVAFTGVRSMSHQPVRAQFSIRELQVSDLPACNAFLNHLDPNDIRMRFAAPRNISVYHFLPGLIGGINGLAFAAVNMNGTILGIINLIYMSADSAEVAVIVRPDYKRQGIGGSVLEHVIQRARRDGLSKLVGHVLADNKAMLALARTMGFQRIGRDPLLIEMSRSISSKPVCVCETIA